MGTLYCKKHRPSDEKLNRGPDSLWSLKIPECPLKKSRGVTPASWPNLPTVSNICRISNKNTHSNAKCCIRILGVRQAAWHTKCIDELSLHFNVFFFLPAHSQYCGKSEHQCGEDVVYLKTETKPFTQNAYLLHFLEGHLSSMSLTQKSPKPCQMNLSSTSKNM